jgi:hypothetical protein
MVMRMILLSVLGCLVGSLGTCGNFFPLGERSELGAKAYRVAKVRGGTALRMAMVHDVLHERYLVHGEAWNRERVQAARAVVAGYEEVPGMMPSERVLGAMDDVAVGLVRLHEEGEAVEVMRRKLRLLGKEGPTMERYSAEANLGTALVHGAFAKAMGGDEGARAALKEGLGHIEKAMGLNPGAHFGRERWQALAVRHFLLALEDPEWLLRSTVTGTNMEQRPLRRTRMRGWGVRLVADEQLSDERRSDLRSGIERVNFDYDWVSKVGLEDPMGVRFDEPTLGVIGMWTLGGGANAHFALALAKLMEDQGQWEIAWNGYERAVELAGEEGAGFSREADVAKRMVAYCRRRQEGIARAESRDAARWESDMRSRHRAELAWGQAYQRAYQAYEAREIAAGRGVDGAVDYAAFFKGREEIASDPGLADDVLVTQTGPRALADFVPSWLVGVGLCLWADELDRRRRERHEEGGRRGFSVVS